MERHNLYTVQATIDFDRGIVTTYRWEPRNPVGIEVREVALASSEGQTFLSAAALIGLKAPAAAGVGPDTS